MGIFFQSLKSATEFRALTWVLPSVWHILPIFLLFGELLTLQVSADLSFPTLKHLVLQNCGSSCYVIGNYLCNCFLVSLPPMSVSLGQGPCLCNCYFIRTRGGRGVCLGLPGASRLFHFWVARVTLSTHFSANTFAQVNHTCRQSSLLNQLPNVSFVTQSELHLESPQENSQLSCQFFQEKEKPTPSC